MPTPEQSLVNVRPFIQPVLMALLITAVGWVVFTTNTNNTNLEVLTVRVEYLRAETGDIKALIEERPSAESFQFLAEKVEALHQRMNALAGDTR